MSQIVDIPHPRTVPVTPMAFPWRLAWMNISASLHLHHRYQRRHCISLLPSTFTLSCEVCYRTDNFLI